MKYLVYIGLICSCYLASAQTLPEFKFQGVNGKAITKNNLIKNKPVMVILFDPYCDHCEIQANEIKDHEDQFRDVNMLWVSIEEHENNLKFQKTHLDGVPNTIVCKDDDFMFDSWFGYSEIPSIYCYNSKWELVGSYKTEQSATVLLKALK